MIYLDIERNDTMYCESCGSKIKQGELFCPECGTKVVSEEIEITSLKKRSKKKTMIITIAILAVFVIVAGISLWLMGRQQIVMDGSSMESTIYNNDNILINKLAYKFGNPERYDIIAFYPYGEDGDIWVKRIYALPGETIVIKEQDIYINGTKIKDIYASSDMSDAGIAEESYTLAENEYFVLGDNRAISLDSRDDTLGAILRKNIIGKVSP